MSSTHVEPPAAALADHYRVMQTIRRFELRTAELFEDGHVTGSAHSCAGQEAVAVGTAAAMAPDDYLVGHHRSHGHLIARGADLRRMYAEMFGRRTGYCRGLGGSMHIADMSLNILGCNGIVAGGLSHGCGAALSAVLRGTSQAAVAFLGDGAASQGAAHEAINLAATWRLPVVFVVENNQYALSVDWRAMRATPEIAPRAAGYGMAGASIDGNDVEAVRATVADALARARAGEGPTLIEMATFRLSTHHSLRANLPDVRDPEFVASWEAKDPLPRLAQQLLAGGSVDADGLAAIDAEVDAAIEEAIRLGLADEPASEEDLREATYAPHRSHPPVAERGERKLGYVDAIHEALDQQLAADDSVFVMGEDVGKVGGLFRATAGLFERYGAARIRDTPISESGFVGAGIGAALTGMRPVVELQFSDFSAVAYDQLVNQAAKLRFMMGGEPTVPLVVRAPSGGGVRLGAQHSQSLEAVFAHIPGLVVVMPSNPYDAKGLLTAAIQDDNPVVFFEPKSLFFGGEVPVPEEPYAITLGTAHVARAGTDVTIVALGALVPEALRAAGALEREGISAEVIDPRTIVPLDIDTILASVAKTGRVVVAHEAVGFGGIGGEIAAQIADRGFWDLDAPVARVASPFMPMPYQKDLERLTLPGAGDVAAAARALVAGEEVPAR